VLAAVGSGFRPLLQRVRVWALVASALLLVGCHVKVDVRVSSNADGHGRVTVTATLDKDAAGQAGSLLLDDVTQAGWTVTSVNQKDGGRVVTATHPFKSPTELATILEQVGPFKGVRLSTYRSLLTTRTRFAGSLDLSQ